MIPRTKQSKYIRIPAIQASVALVKPQLPLLVNRLLAERAVQAKQS